MPFLHEHLRYVAANYLESGILVSSKMVPTVAVNWRLQPRQLNSLRDLFLLGVFRLIL